MIKKDFLKKIMAKNGKFIIFKINKEIAATFVKTKDIALFFMRGIKKMMD